MLFEDNTYSMVFSNIHTKTIHFTRDLINKTTGKNEKESEMRKWIQSVSQVYGFSPPTFVHLDGELGQVGYYLTGGGIYIKNSHCIILFQKLSYTTLFHEFRHAMQFALCPNLYRNDVEEDARAWSVSLLRQSAPALYQTAKQNGWLRFN